MFFEALLNESVSVNDGFSTHIHVGEKSTHGDTVNHYRHHQKH